MIDVKLVEQYMDTLPYTLWATWDLSQPERKRMAAEWFVSQMKELTTWMGQNDATEFMDAIEK